MFKFLNFKQNLTMEKFSKECFVCKKEVSENNRELNPEVNLPVCNECKGTTLEKETVQEYFDELADGLVCGCI